MEGGRGAANLAKITACSDKGNCSKVHASVAAAAVNENGRTCRPWSLKVYRSRATA